jgi:fatty acid desaturase
VNERIEDIAIDETVPIHRKPVVENVGQPLEPAVRGDRTSPSPAASEAIHRLFIRTPGTFILQLSVTWVSIIAAVTIAVHIQTWWISCIVVAFVATRQNVLGLLMHEQCHRLAFNTRFGDVLCNIFAAYPLLVTLEGYRRVHLAHHQNYFTERDPDYIRKQGEEWTFPQKLSRFLTSVARDLSGLSTIKTIRGKNHAKDSRARRADYGQIALRVLYYLALGGAITILHGWAIVGIYWLLPLFTYLQLIVRWGAICEHKYNLVHPTVAESTPIIIPRWWEQVLLPNLNFTYHIYHHWYPRIPYVHLTSVHRVFCREGLVNEQQVFDGYVAYMKYLFRNDPPRNRG